MSLNMKMEIGESVKGFRLPRYQEIPDVGLYLEQVAEYISEYLKPLGNITLTGSMISNYVKKGLVSNPMKKQYDRDQIAYLFFIAVAKMALSMDDIRLMVEMQKKTYGPQVAYDYFCLEFENIIQYIFGMKESPDVIGVDDTEEKTMLRNTIITVAHKVYLDKYFEKIRN
ncbi:MAG: DUF1836 domain-containing protein [Lachnospiraceae bacterium]|nr:DUF1836 domain-containing protein [Lachnospiraceae bacterium]